MDRDKIDVVFIKDIIRHGDEMRIINIFFCKRLEVLYSKVVRCIEKDF